MTKYILNLRQEITMICKKLLLNIKENEITFKKNIVDEIIEMEFSNKNSKENAFIGGACSRAGVE